LVDSSITIPMEKTITVKLPGALTSESGEVLEVALGLTVKQLLGEGGVANEEIEHIELLIVVPDGKYVLSYFYQRTHRSHVQVKFSTLVAPR